MLLELGNLGKTLFTTSKAFTRQTKTSKLIDSLTEEKSPDYWISNNGSQVGRLAPEHGQDLYEKAKTAIQPLKQYLDAHLGDARRAEPSLISALALPAKEVKSAPQSGALTLMTHQSFTLSKISLGLAIGSFLFKPLALASLVFVILGSPELIRRSYRQLIKEHKTTVDLLILASVVVGVTLGTGSLLAGGATFTFMVSFNVFLAEYAQKLMRDVREDAKGSLVDVFRQQPSSVWALIDGVEISVPVESLQTGDIVVVNAGETIAIDGRIVEGLASVDQHILTGEAQPAEKGPGDEVFALTMVAAGKIQILVEKTGEETTAAQIGRILNQTMNFKTEMQLWAENIADKSVVPTLVTSALILPFLPGISWAILLAHPKYKGTVATYINILSYLNVTAKNGILLKDGRVLELLNQVDTVVFDKTGTLTETQPTVGPVYAWSDYTESDVLIFAAAAEYRQTHPVAIAILQEAESRALPIPQIEEAAYKVGYGLTVTVDRLTVRVGSLRFMEEEQLILPAEAETVIATAHQQGHSLIFVALDRQVVGAIELEPTVRPEAQAVVRALRKRGVKATYIISGDHEAPTRKLAADLGIDHYFAETLPEDKAALIDQLQQEGKTVCYVGDGINDAIALKKAAVSISLQGASTVATDTAQVVLMKKDLMKICELFDIAREFERNMKKTFGLVIAPHLLSLAGILFLHFGLLSVIILCQLGLAVGVGNALLPRLRDSSVISDQ